MARDTARAIATPIGHEPALDLTVKDRRRLLGRTPARPRAADRHGANVGAWRDFAAAGFFRGRVVGAGRSRSAAGTSVRRRARDAGRRPLRGTGRQDRTARVAGAQRHRGRSFARAAQPAAREPHASLRSRPRLSPPTHWNGKPEPFDAVLLDAPCSSTGTIRRHPDVPWLKSEADLSALTSLQQRLLDRAVELLKPGGTLVYCICSLEPEEGEDQIARFARARSAH